MKPRSHIAVLSVLVLGLSVGIVRAEEANQVFLEIEEFPGFHGQEEVGGEPVSDWIEVLAFSDGISVPGASSGKARGKARPEEIVVRKRIDQSTPLFYNALSRNESIPTAVFHFFGNDLEGLTFQFYTVTLTNARLSSVRTTYEHGVGFVQEIRFLAQSIEWSYDGQGGVTEAQSTYAVF